MFFLLSQFHTGGSVLPVNRRQKAYPNGTLIIEQIQQGEDEGKHGTWAEVIGFPVPFIFKLPFLSRDLRV